jgi:hypothetical protein
MSPRLVYSYLALGISLVGCSVLGQELSPFDQSKVDFFENKIRPVLVEYCYECHSQKTQDPSGEFRLDSAVALRKGGARGGAITPDMPEKSLILRAILYEDPDMQMPPSGKLSKQVVDDFRQWIRDGAVDPRTLEGAVPVGPSRQEIAAKHWSFQPLPMQQDVPSIDRFISEGLAAKGIIPNESASKRELIRRLYYDLLGLPPTNDEMSSWMSQPLGNYESWVDTLLDSPHFGERMARRWMDVSRYADNKGYVFQEDREYKFAWRYRNWLIDAFNQDMPYDRFVRFQIAADRLDTEADHRHLDAMGFLTLGRRFLNNENDIADDRIDLITRGFLGLSVSCARCHDHKFDPISMADYYSLHATLVSNKEPKDEPGPLRLIDADNIRPAVIFMRGNPGSRGEKVPKEFVKFISSVSRPLETGSGRLDLAEAIADTRNPLTSRVIVNRVWGWIMGAPLVDTPSDFGIRTDLPVQRELLDSMAIDFMQNEQSIKHLVKRIVMSDVYRRSSAHDPEKHRIDPENRLWWRGVRKRLDFESLRDSILVATQRIDRTVGGKSIKMMKKPFSDRRTIYAYIDRQNLEGVFRSFDFASPDSHAPLRFTTTVPQQSLFLMNSPMIEHYCLAFANRLVTSESGNDPDWLISELFSSVLLRIPTLEEERWIKGYLSGEDSKALRDLSVNRVADLIKALICTNEFCFID